MAHANKFHKAMAKAGYNGKKHNSLVEYNDDGRATFKQIGAAIKACPECVFKPAKKAQ